MMFCFYLYNIFFIKNQYIILLQEELRNYIVSVILILFTSVFCIKYETLLLSSSIAKLSNPINKFIRYTTIKRENKTINIAIYGLSAYDQLDNALESPIDKKNWLKY
jgi:hypothetical protein